MQSARACTKICASGCKLRAELLFTVKHCRLDDQQEDFVMADPVTPAAPSALEKPKRGRKPNAAKLAAPAAPARKPRAKAASAADAAPAVKRAKAKITSTASTLGAKVKSAAQDSGIDWNKQAEQLKEQAGKVARSAAGTAKVKTGAAMEGLSRLIADTAGTVDSKLGPQYGDYARQAAEAVAGAAKSLDDKDVDQLLGEARDFVRKSPAVAIGAAAIAGYVLMRLAKGSGDKDA